MREPVSASILNEAATAAPSSAPTLEFRNIVKSFPGQVAVDDVSFSVAAGEIHALVGENGAGKTTLIKCLGGIYEFDSGSILIDGETVHFRTPHEATDAGIGFIHQEPALVPQLSLTENVNLGLPFQMGRGGVFIDWRAQADLARKMLRAVSLELDPSMYLQELSVAERQLVAVARMLAYSKRIVVFDEPTAPLTQLEVDRLFEIIARLRDNGAAIIYISHRLEEVFRLADNVTVLRNGRLIATRPTSEISMQELTRLIVGKDTLVPRAEGQAVPQNRKVVLRAVNLRDRLLKGVSFELREGEILGLAGLAGSGRTNILEAVFGARKLESGSLELDGEPLILAHPSGAIGRGIALLTEERKKDGYIPSFPLWQHITLPWLDKFKSGPFLRLGAERRAAALAMKQFDVRGRSVETKVRELSGGNQQKAILARWLSQPLRLLLLDEPTHGVDVGAKEEIYRIIRALAAEGLPMIIVSSELEELESICHRVILLVEGRVIGELAGSQLTKDHMLTALLMRNTNGDNDA